MKTVCFFLIIIHPFLISGQSITGKIKTPNNQAIPYVNISIVGTSSGTGSSYNGVYKLELNNISDSEIRFSSIGYISKTINASELIKEPNVILAKNIYDLDEMVIMPDSSLRSLLRDAYRLIPKNYPNTPTSYQGFYRTSLKDANGNYLRFTEAIVDSYKSSYKKKEDGVSKIIKSRKYINNKETADFPLYFYGGLNIFHSMDYVKGIFPFLKGDNAYDYNLTGISTYNGQEVYIVELKKAGGLRYTAKMYIEKNTLA